MYWLIGLFALEALVEAFLCIGGFAERKYLRAFCSMVAVAALLVASVGLAITAWRVWIWLVPLSGYRIVNVLRAYARRLPAPHLRTVSFRAFEWLLTGQILLTVVAGGIRHWHLGSEAVASFAALQLLVSITLLRTSLHTWRHAAPISDSLSHIPDRQLPAVSVLIPARNETEQLEACLRTLVASDYPKLEIIVLDDCSAVRRTPEIIRSFAHEGVLFMQGTVPDENRWLSKNWAYDQLAHKASGELLLFCGVDTAFEPSSIRELVEILYSRKKDMLSVMPLRAKGVGHDDYALLQAMRYYWEICLPRRLFKRPPVLSTCWLIKRTSLDHMGGFESTSRSITPEAHFARQTVVTDAYAFIRSDERLGVYSNKPTSEQYGTSVRVRYPQLHRRLELVALTASFELLFLLGPFVALCTAGYMIHTMAYVAVWGVSIAALFVTYGMVTKGARLANPWYGWIFMPVAFVIDMVLLHISCWKYEFSDVYWKGRNVCIPVMQISSAGSTPKPTH